MIVRKKRGIATFIIFLLGIMCAFAQDPVPCSGDPDDAGYDPNGCPVPLDTWVILLAIAAVGFGAWYLHKNQKRLFPQ